MSEFIIKCTTEAIESVADRGLPVGVGVVQAGNFCV